MELADLVIVTKADGDLIAAANRAAADYHAALHLMRPKYPGIAPQVMQVSSIEGTGIDKVWSALSVQHSDMKKRGFLKNLREEQARRWFWSEVQAVISDDILSNETLGNTAQKLESAVVNGNALPYSAARALFRHIIAA